MSYRLKQVSFAIGSKYIVKDLEFSFKAGNLVSIIGPNGAGKTTLLKLMSGELKPSGGEIFLNDFAFSELSLKERANKRAVMTQSSSVVFDFLVDEILEMGWVQGSSDVFLKTCADVVNSCGLDELMGRKFNTLSGGEQQRVQFARALLQVGGLSKTADDRFLLLDEPTSNMDVAYELNLLNLAKEVRKTGVGVIVVLHDLNLAARFSDQIILMNSGLIVASGQPEEVLSDRILSDVYSTQLRVERHEELDRIVVYS
jgi:iron complex transport system ATP-binding protein